MIEIGLYKLMQLFRLFYGAWLCDSCKTEFDFGGMRIFSFPFILVATSRHVVVAQPHRAAAENWDSWGQKIHQSA